MEQKEPVRIAQMMTDMNYGGVEAVIMNYYRHIDRNKIQFDFYALEGSEIPQKKEIEEMGGKVIILPRYTHPSAYIRSLSDHLRSGGYQIVHSNMNALSIFSLGTAEKCGVPVRILHNHSTSAPGETKKNIAKCILKPLSVSKATER